MSNKSKGILFNIPLIGLIYLVICLFKMELWFENKTILAITGTGIQCLTIVILSIILKLYLK
jgi:hypothetical protein